MTMISMSGLDLSFMYGPGGGVPPPAAPTRARRPRRPRRPPAEIIDLAAVRKAKGLKAKKLSKAAKATIIVSPAASARVKRLAADLGLKIDGKAKAKGRSKGHSKGRKGRPALGAMAAKSAARRRAH
jgi:hypothetical protein